MSKTGINFARCNVTSAALHNERDAAYLESVRASGKATYELFDDRTPTNLSWKNPAYGDRTLPQILEAMRERYRQGVGQEPQEEDRVRTVIDKKTGLAKTVTTAGWSPIREGVCPVKEDTTIEDFEPVTAWLAEKGVTVISIDIHRDEGYEDPVSRDRKYNYHAHIIADWTNHLTGKTAKLTAKDMSELNQVVLPAALGMEAGVSKDVSGAEHLTPQQQREKAAAKHEAELRQKVAELQGQVKDLTADKERLAAERDKAEQRADSALKRAEAAEKAASREQLRSNAADVGARVLGLFGRGAVAEANTDRDEALRKAEEAETRAAAAEKARTAAETARDEAVEAQKQAEIARSAAERARRTAEDSKAEYGRERYRDGKTAGYTEGYTAGTNSVAADTRALNSALATKQTTIDNLKADRAELEEWVPTAANWRQYRDEMRQAGLDDQTIKRVFRNGSATVTIGHKLPALSDRYGYETNVWIGSLKTAVNRSEHGVWFRARAIDDVWRRVTGYLKAVKDHVWQGLGRKPAQQQSQSGGLKPR